MLTGVVLAHSSELDLDKKPKRTWTGLQLDYRAGQSKNDREASNAARRARGRFRSVSVKSAIR